MDRRSLVVGAAALAAVAGTRISAAQASTIGAATTSTVAHARQVLEQVDLDLGLVNPEGAQLQLMDSFDAYDASAPREPAANDLEGWTRQRFADLTGTGSLETALGNPQTRTLLAFGFVVHTQHQDRQLPEVARSVPVPAGLARLEPDFFPELVRQIGIRTRSTPAFADLLQASAAKLDDVAAKKKSTHPSRAGILVMFALLIVGPVLTDVANKHLGSS
jgi:hypothetical protein